MNDTLIPYNNLYLLRAFGLYNSHILCYFNSLLQSLFSCTSLTEYLLNNEKKFIENNFMSMYINILKKYIILDMQINKSSNNQYNNLTESSNILMFNEFLISIKNKNIKFGYNQEDSGELLVLLLDVINDNYIYNLFYNKYRCDIYCKNFTGNHYNYTY